MAATWTCQVEHLLLQQGNPLRLVPSYVVGVVVAEAGEKTEVEAPEGGGGGNYVPGPGEGGGPGQAAGGLE